jgi:arylsulfatase A-like enzyme
MRSIPISRRISGVFPILGMLVACHGLYAAARPNILFIFLDDYGWKDTSYMGSDFYETPHIDRLASEGMIFTDAYACAANCAPSRACLLSGQYTPRHQIYNVGTRPRGNKQFRKLEHIPGVDVLDPKITTWAEVAQESGYRTATIGKWHLSSDPLSYGFDVNVGGGKSGSPPRGYYSPHPNVPGLEGAPDDEYLTDRLTDEAIRFIDESGDQPWLLYLTHFAVHTPLNAKRELAPKYEAKAKGSLHSHVAMATMIQSVDDGVGKIRAQLSAKGVLDETIIIFYSDNGGYGPATDMDPLKGYKGTYYEGGIRVPFFVRWPGVVDAGGRSAEPVIGVDLLPTLCEMVGAAVPAGQIADGQSLLPLLNGSRVSLKPRGLFWHFPAYLQAYQVVDEQRDPLFRSRPCSVIREGQWKLHHYFEDNAFELYDLSTDIGEKYNLALVRPHVVETMSNKLDQWRDTTKAAMPTGLNPAYDPIAEAAAMEQARR